MVKDSLALGLALGFIGPILGAIIFYLLRLSHEPFGHFVEKVFMYPTFMAPLLSFGAIVNLLFFFIFLWTEKALSARGVIFATLLYAFFVVVLKFLF